MIKPIATKPTGSLVVWHIQNRLRAAGHDIAVDGDLGPKTFWDNSETLKAVLNQLGGPVALPVPPAPASSPSGKRVFIDVGHGMKPGGFDPGAVHAPSKTTEHSLNLIAAGAMSDRLRVRGLEVRVADERLENYNAGTAAKGFDVFVSFHHNAAAGPVQYALTLYGSKATQMDKTLAALVSARVAAELGIPDKGAREMSLAVLSGARAAGVPAAILVEPYFIHAQTPERPSASLMPEWSRRAGESIADAIADHLGV
jgi:N-acetylmuramoyl-L-alanine amidase